LLFIQIARSRRDIIAFCQRCTRAFIKALSRGGTCAVIKSNPNKIRHSRISRNILYPGEYFKRCSRLPPSHRRRALSSASILLAAVNSVAPGYEFTAYINYNVEAEICRHYAVSCSYAELSCNVNMCAALRLWIVTFKVWFRKK